MELVLTRPQASVYVPDGSSVDHALQRTTHLVVGAHADDVEFMAWSPILACHDDPHAWLTAVVVGDGAGSPRSGAFAATSDEQLRHTRLAEQQAAARLGGYSAVICLDFPSSVIRTPHEASLRQQLRDIVALTRPRSVYTHSPSDRHDTHVAVCTALVDALRMLPASQRPTELLGCEVWGSLDWLAETDKVVVDVSGALPLLEPMMAVYASQIGGGKRYDLATTGRKRANATYLRSHEVDVATACEYLVDMGALLRDESLSLRALVRRWAARFATEMDARLALREGLEATEVSAWKS